MKCRTLLFTCSLLLLLVALYGCASRVYLEERSNEWITRPLSELKQAMNAPGSYASKIGWEETTYPLANGNFVFVEPIDKECSIHWEVTPREIIIGSRAEGAGCDQKPAFEPQSTTAPLPSTRW